MLFTTFTVKDNEYKLRLNARNIVNLEKQIGCNPISIFGTGDTIPSITTMVHILHNSLQQYQANITLEKTYSIFDEWLDDGHTITDFIQVIVDIYRVSGLIAENTTEKN